ncbi:PRC and DUF2382 domain-containing protein [Pseudonocardia charpentierae]|uniref:PRC and DUF2382 domain-containing protein n=1 Tax=Pseudonocardia charpentierae TaxID=3075545 RepID=A0ABU2NHZ6_9PSEU|nr:PRC and DUF2382 domain-containing protein [Pseudonocardia sp. DSM 45834]MDT0353576.1 PRC and DUF2382 domain-containing protein [Pseudonocardia sp. DSM 45834]
MTIANMSDPSSMTGAPVMGGDGQKLGKVDAIYFDNDTDRPEWAAVKSGLFGSHVSLVPLSQGTWNNGTLTVPFSKDALRTAPHHDPDASISPTDEDELYRHYGISSSGYDSTRGDGVVDSGRTDTVTTGRDRHDRADETGIVGRDTSGPTTDDAMTRSEEQLRVGTETREAGRARLRKHVVTEHQQTTVPVSHEEVTLEREPITDANRGDAYTGPAISEEEHEVTLHAERPVVDTEAVAVERVQLGKQTVTEQETVSGEVRKEQIDLDTGDVTTTDSTRRRRGKKRN